MARTRRAKKKREKVSAKHRAETHKTGFDSTSIDLPEGMSLFKLKAAGTKRIDIIPFVAGKGNPFADEGTEYFERTFFVHRGIGPNNDSYTCAAKTAGKKCPICDARATLAQDPEADEEVIKSLMPKERQLWQIIDHSDRDKGIQLWDMSFHLFGRMLDAKIRNADDDDDYEFFADVENGLTLKLGVEEKTWAGNTFYEVSDIEFKPRKTQYDEDILEESHCLDDLVKIVPYDKLKSIYLQMDEEEDEPKKSKSRRTSKSRKQSRSTAKNSGTKDETDDEDEASWIDDEDDDEPAPKKKAAKKKAPKKKAAKKKPARKKATKKKAVKKDPEPEDEDSWIDDEDDDDDSSSVLDDDDNSVIHDEDEDSWIDDEDE